MADVVVWLLTDAFPYVIGLWVISGMIEAWRRKHRGRDD